MLHSISSFPVDPNNVRPLLRIALSAASDWLAGIDRIAAVPQTQAAADSCFRPTRPPLRQRLPSSKISNLTRNATEQNGTLILFDDSFCIRDEIRNIGGTD